MSTPRIIALVLTLLGGAGLAEAKSRKDPLLGTWQAEAIERKGQRRKVEGMKLLAIFEPKGRFVSVLSDSHHGERRRVGTWKRVKPYTVVTVVGKRTDRMVYRIDRRTKQLVLRNKQSGQRLFLRRVK